MIEYAVRGEAFLEVVGCTSGNLTCLQDLSIDDILNAQNNVTNVTIPGHGVASPWGPYIDGILLNDTVGILDDAYSADFHSYLAFESLWQWHVQEDSVPARRRR